MSHAIRGAAKKMTWIEWIDRVEAIMGRDIDDAEVTLNVRSPLDKAYDAYETRVSPVAYLDQSSIHGASAPD